jgi:acyl-CoA thioesterase-1
VVRSTAVTPTAVPSAPRNARPEGRAAHRLYPPVRRRAHHRARAGRVEHRLYPPVRRRARRQAHSQGRLNRQGALIGFVVSVAMLGAVTFGASAAAQNHADAAPLSFTGVLRDRDVAAFAGVAVNRPQVTSPKRAIIHQTTHAAFPSPTTCTTTATTSSRPSIPRPVAAFLGDSYTTGYVGAGMGRAGWPAIVSAAYRWRESMKAVAGTGFVNPGWTNQPMGTLVRSVIRLRPGIVFVAGGHNDRRYPTAVTAGAADAVLERLRGGLPDAILVVIGPIWQDGSPASSISELRDHVERKSAAVGALFIDPIRGGWFAGPWHRLIGPDGVHPTDAGQRHIAKMVMTKLQADPRLRVKTSRPSCRTVTRLVASPSGVPSAGEPTAKGARRVNPS